MDTFVSLDIVRRALNLPQNNVSTLPSLMSGWWVLCVWGGIEWEDWRELGLELVCKRKRIGYFTKQKMSELER